jgi:hypothetical protein
VKAASSGNATDRLQQAAAADAARPCAQGSSASTARSSRVQVVASDFDPRKAPLILSPLHNTHTTDAATCGAAAAAPIMTASRHSKLLLPPESEECSGKEGQRATRASGHCTSPRKLCKT